MLGQNDLMALRADWPSVLELAAAFFARLATSSENAAQSMKRDWRAALSCMPCLALASSDTSRLWLLRSFGGLLTCASEIQPSAMPQHTVGAICTWLHFCNCQGIEMVSKLDGQNVNGIQHPSKTPKKHNGLNHPNNIKQ